MLFNINGTEYIVDFTYMYDFDLRFADFMDASISPEVALQINQKEEEKRDVAIGTIMRYNRETKTKTTLGSSVSIKHPHDRFCKSTARKLILSRLLDPDMEFIDVEPGEVYPVFSKEDRRSFWLQYFKQTNETYKDGKH